MNYPLILFIVSALGGLVLLVAGVFLLQGAGWALVAGGAALFAVSAFLRKGMTSG